MDQICCLEFQVVEAVNAEVFKDDLTDLFVFLLQDAIICEDEERYKKFYASAKR